MNYSSAACLMLAAATLGVSSLRAQDFFDLDSPASSSDVMHAIFADIGSQSDSRKLFNLYVVDLLLAGDSAVDSGRFEIAAGANALAGLNALASADNAEIAALSTTLTERIKAALQLGSGQQAQALLSDSATNTAVISDFDQWFEISTEPEFEYLVQVSNCAAFHAVALLDDQENGIAGGVYEGHFSFATEQPESVLLRLQTRDCSGANGTITRRRQPLQIELAASLDDASQLNEGMVYSTSVNADESRWFIYSGREKQRYRIEIHPLGGFDSVLEMYDGTGSTMLSMDDDSGESAGSLLEYETSGIGDLRYFKVRGYSNDAGDFEISISARRSLNELAINLVDTEETTVDSDANKEGYRHWWRINAVAGETYHFSAQPIADGVDTYLTLLAEDGHTELDFDDDGGVGLASRIVYEAQENGILYLASEDLADSGLPYSVRVNSTTSAKRDVQAIEVGTEQASFGFELVHMWSLETEAGVSYTIETLPEELLDTFITVYRESDGNLAGEDDDGGSGLGSRLTFVADGSKYLIEVESLTGEAGGYDLTVTRD